MGRKTVPRASSENAFSGKTPQKALTSNMKNKIKDMYFKYEITFCYWEFSFEVDYDKTREIEYLIKKHNIFVIDRAFGSEGIEYKIRDDLDKITLIKKKL
jgi:putative IMPACT (imprinted ancient) family translation regulator